MPPVVEYAPGLFVWTLTLASGATRTVMASSLQSAIGNAPNVVGATRGAAFTGDGAPVVTSSLTPATAAIGAASFTLHVMGTGFRTGCQIIWNGGAEPTTVVSATEVTTSVNMATATTPTTLPVLVRTLAGQDSNAQTFTITATRTTTATKSKTTAADRSAVE